MIDFEQLAVLAEDCGFTHSVPLDVSKLEFLQDVRDMCNAEQCNNYNKSWSCPPACGSLEDMRERVKGYATGLLVQTVGDIEDSYDWDGIMEASVRHKDNFGRMWDELEKQYASLLAMGAGSCSLCNLCAYPDAPCRFPHRMSVSMEACGLFVSRVCADNGLAYNYGQDKIAFTSCYLFPPP